MSLITNFASMDTLTQFELFVIAGSLIGIWIKHQSDYSSLKGRVIALETDNTEFKNDVKQLLKEVQELKILLAKNQMQ